MRLYVKRVFINDNFQDLIPRWLLFLRGVVDSEDLPLNVGREILQQSRSLRIIRQKLVRKALDMIGKVAEEKPEEYQVFWKNFGKYLKVGIIEDDSNKDALLPLCRFHSTFTTFNGTRMTSLQEYVKRMPEDQKSIYYVIGETRAQAAASPALESLKKKGYEVLLLSEPIDEMTLQNIDKFEDKTIVDAAKESPKDLSAEEKQQKADKNVDSEDFRRWMKLVLGDKITRVEASTRLVESPAMIVQSEYGVSPNMQKYLRAQAVAENDESISGKGSFSTIFNQAVLEINLDHPIIRRIRKMYESENDSDEAKERVQLLFNTAALAGGYVLDNSAEYAQMVVNMLIKSS
jgi:heat shock protein beta